MPHRAACVYHPPLLERCEAEDASAGIGRRDSATGLAVVYTVGMGSAPLTTARTGPIGAARALACAVLVGLMTLPPGGLDALAARPVESLACGEECGSEPELTSVGVRHAHPASGADRAPGMRVPREFRTTAHTVTPHVTPGRDSAVFRLRC